MLPASICFEQGVCGDDELSHDGGDGDLGGFSCCDELLVFGLQVRVVASSDEGRHVESLPDIGSAAADEALAFPCAGLSCHRSETGEASGLLVLEATEFGHRGDELVGSERPDASDAGEDLVSAGECCIGGDQVGNLSVERFDMPIDLVKLLPTLALEKSDGEVFLAVFERGAITRQTVAGIDQFGHLGLLRAARRPYRRLEGGSHAGQQHGVEPHLQILRRHRRPLLLRLEQPRQSAMAHHVHRHAAVGAWGLIIAPWYQTPKCH